VRFKRAGVGAGDAADFFWADFPLCRASAAGEKVKRMMKSAAVVVVSKRRRRGALGLKV
jgi:hypothetical protein